MSLRSVVFLGLFLSTAIVFTLFPGIDPAVSGLFYRPNGGFFLWYNPVIRAIHDGLPPLTIGFVILLLVALGWAAWTRRTLMGISWRPLAYLLAVLALGPGLLVNTILKDNWGRARPSHTVEFGGQKEFSPALVPSDQCDGNCSFVGGHAAMAFYPMVFAFILATPRRRRLALAGGIASGCVVGLARIAEGGHYLSDILFAGLIDYAVAWGCARAMLPKPGEVSS